MKKMVVNKYKEKYDVFIGRPSDWGNPFSHQENTNAKFKVATREEAVSKYKEWLMGNKELMARLPELKGKVLGCFCAPRACHGDVLAELANKETCEEDSL